MTPHCPSCGYTEKDAAENMDHHLCRNAGNAPWEKKFTKPASPDPSPTTEPKCDHRGCEHSYRCCCICGEMKSYPPTPSVRAETRHAIIDCGGKKCGEFNCRSCQVGPAAFPIGAETEKGELTLVEGSKPRRWTWTGKAGTYQIYFCSDVDPLLAPPQQATLEGKNEDVNIAGEVGFLANKFGLSVEATRAFYAMFCGQAKRWEQKVTFCETRIINQKAEIARVSSQLLQSQPLSAREELAADDARIAGGRESREDALYRQR